MVSPMTLDPATIRTRFPALTRRVGGRPAVFADGPGGTQVPLEVIDALGAHLTGGTANLGGAFVTSRRAEEVVAGARRAVADLLGCRPGEVMFGQNMTSLTFAVSRALARTWRPGEEIVVTRLDHDANITPWLRAAEEREVEVRWWDVRPDEWGLDPADLGDLLGDRTRLVAVTHASNALGTVVDVGEVTRRAHPVGALVYVDAVHYVPHRLVDVVSSGCDFLVASAYKFFGPHQGVLYGRRELLEELETYRVRPAPERPPGKWETGTQSFEGLAGVTAAVDYLASLGGPSGTRRERLGAAFASIEAHEAALSRRFLELVAELSGLRVYGVTDPGRPDRRTPTFAVEIAGRHPRRAAEELGRRGVFVWDGHYYAVEIMERLGVLERGGLVRIGFVHYNTLEEVSRVAAALAELGR